MAIDRRLCNVILLGFGFMFVFTAFQTFGNIEQTIIKSVNDDDPTFKGDGYTSLAIIYVMLSLGNWAAPSIIAKFGPRLSMVIGSITYLIFILSFLLPKTWLLYVVSVVIGLGASIIWTGQGNYLTLNSDDSTISRNSGVFWALLQCSMLFGNLFVFFAFQGKTKIDLTTRNLVTIVLSVVCGIGVLILILLRPAVSGSGTEIVKRAIGPIKALKEAFTVISKPEMLLLCVTFFYTGLELSFYSGVYSPSIGFTLSLGETSKQLVGMSGIFIGVGEIFGGVVFGLLGTKTAKYGRDPIVILGLIVHLVTFFLIFLNLPNSAPFGDTHDTAFMTSNAYLAIACSAFLGFADSCFNTQIYAALGTFFKEQSAPAFAIFKFTQSIAAALAFVYSQYIGLYYQLLILVITAVLGTVTYCMAEWRVRKYKKDDEATYSGSTS